MMKLKTIAAFIGACSVVGIAQAQTYQGEIFGGYDEVSGEDVSAYTLGGRFHFAPVNTQGHPLAEAAFLEKSSNLEARWTRVDADPLTTDLQSLSAEFYVPNSMFYLGAGIERTKVDIDGLGSASDNAWNARLGITPIHGLLVWTEFYEDIDYSDAINIHGKYVTALGGEQALNLLGGYTSFDDGSNLYVGADYYIDRHLSLGVQLDNTDYDAGGSENNVEVRANNYFTPNFNLGLAYVFGEDEDSWGIRAGYRF